MTRNKELELIRNDFGELAYALSIGVFNPILDSDISLHEILSEILGKGEGAYNRYIHHKFEYGLIEEVYKRFISRMQLKVEEAPNSPKSIRDLLDIEDYIIFRIKDGDEQTFKEYYKAEEMPHFPSSTELNNMKAFILIRKHSHNLRREDFIEPSPEDEYARSVILVTYVKGMKNSVCLTNRYGVLYSDDLDVITKGLTKAFEKEEELVIKNPQKGLK